MLCRLSYSTDVCATKVTPERAYARAVPTGFEPATSGLTGRRELHFTTGPGC